MTRAEKDAFRQIDNELGDLKNETYRALRALESGRAALASGILRDVLGCNLRPAKLVQPAAGRTEASSMTALAPADRDRLVKFCGMLGSDQLGERASAAAKADGLVRASGRTWDDVLVRGLGGGTQPDSRDDVDDLSPGTIIARYGMNLSQRDRDFLLGILHRHNLSGRQQAWLDDIRARCRR